jgi:hypothetical protein
VDNVLRDYFNHPLVFRKRATIYLFSILVQNEKVYCSNTFVFHSCFYPNADLYRNRPL